MRFATDKIEPHGYFPSYLRLAAELGPDAAVCELGVWQGESLRMWQAIFPLGEVWGVDSDPAAVWPEGTRRVQAAQDDPGLPLLLPAGLGLVVDDASHDGPATQRSFGLLWPLVRPGGYYVVEDWQCSLNGWGPGMLRAAESFLPLLAKRGGECDRIEYRCGLVIIHRAG